MAWTGPVNLDGIGLPPLAETIPRNDGGILHQHYIRKGRTLPPGCVMREIRAVDANATDSRETIIWRVPWAYRIRFEQWAVGYSFIEAVGATPFLRREIPAQHPAKPSLYCSRCTLVSAGGVAVASGNRNRGLVLGPLDLWPSLPMPYYVDNQGTTHQDGAALYELEYRPPGYTIRDDIEMVGFQAVPGDNSELARYVEVHETSSVQGVGINRVVTGSLKQLKFVDGPYASKPVREAGILLMPQAHVEFIHHGLCDIPQDAIDSCRGKVNVLPFGNVSGIRLYGSQTLLFEGAQWERKTGANNRPAFTLHITCNFRPQGWNKFPAADGNLYRATFGGAVADAEFFQSAAFKDLFRPAAPVTYQ